MKEILVHNRPPGTRPNEANVVRGVTCTPELLTEAAARGPGGAVSVESAAGFSVEELSQGVSRYGQVGTTTIGQIRGAGGEVTPTPGRSPNHASVTGIAPDALSELLQPPIRNPARTPRVGPP